MSELSVKVKYFKESELVEIRRFPISNKRLIKFHDFIESLKKRLRINGTNEVVLKYCDNEGDSITIRSDDEFRLSLGDSLYITYELHETREGSVSTLKSVNNNIKGKIKYPDEKLGSNIGDCYEVVFDSKYLVNENRRRSTADIWGTDIYTSDSDYLKALIHSKKIKVTKAEPHDIIATFKILPGRETYVGTYVNGIKSLSYGNWDTSFIIEDYRYGN